MNGKSSQVLTLFYPKDNGEKKPAKKKKKNHKMEKNKTAKKTSSAKEQTISCQF